MSQNSSRKKQTKKKSSDMKPEAKLIMDLRKTKPTVFNHVKKPTLDALSRCSLNILKGQVKVTPKQREELFKYKDQLRSLSRKSLGVNNRRDLLQTGGFFPLLMRIVGPVLSSLLK